MDHVTVVFIQGLLIASYSTIWSWNPIIAACQRVKFLILQRRMKQHHGQFQPLWEADSAPWTAPEFVHLFPQVSVKTQRVDWSHRYKYCQQHCVLFSLWSNSICATALRLLLLWYCGERLSLSRTGTNCSDHSFAVMWHYNHIFYLLGFWPVCSHSGSHLQETLWFSCT